MPKMQTMPEPTHTHAIANRVFIINIEHAKREHRVEPPHKY